MESDELSNAHLQLLLLSTALVNAQHDRRHVPKYDCTHKSWNNNKVACLKILGNVKINKICNGNIIIFE